LQRVAWRLDDQGQLLRRYRRSLDGRDKDDSVERVVASGIEEFSLRYLDEKGNWLETWPPAQAPAPGPDDRDKLPDAPTAVEVRLVQRQIGEVTRVIPLH
jgi:general secretion pathway protein J